MGTRTELDVGTTTLSALVDGEEDAPPVLLLHGLGEQAQTWNAVAAALSDTHRTIAVDLRGHGASGRPGVYSTALMADDLLTAIDRLGYRSVTLVGHSLGALVAVLVAERRPDLVRRLVLEDAVPCPPMPRPPVERPAGPLPFDWPVVPAIRADIADPDPRWWDDLPRITAPTLIVAGGPTSHIPQDRLAEAVTRLPDARLVTLPVGHHVHVADLDGFRDAVLEFLGVTAPVGGSRPATPG
jgi:pimeloyl-ACP methyl ester carboxylesterase